MQTRQSLVLRKRAMRVLISGRSRGLSLGGVIACGFEAVAAGYGVVVIVSAVLVSELSVMVVVVSAVLVSVLSVIVAVAVSAALVSVFSVLVVVVSALVSMMPAIALVAAELDDCGAGGRASVTTLVLFRKVIVAWPLSGYCTKRKGEKGGMG